jgi:hypothetical protein
MPATTGVPTPFLRPGPGGELCGKLNLTRSLDDRNTCDLYRSHTGYIRLTIDNRSIAPPGTRPKAPPAPHGALKEKTPRTLLRRRYLTVIALRIARGRRGGLLRRAGRKTRLHAEHRTSDCREHYRFDHRRSCFLLLHFIDGNSSLANRRARFITHNPPRHPRPPLEKEAPRTARTARQWLAIVVTRIAVLTAMIIADRVAARSILCSILRPILPPILSPVLRPDALTIIIIAIARQAVIAVGIANSMRPVRTGTVPGRWTGVEASLCADQRGGQQRAPDQRLEHNRLGSSQPSCAPRTCGYKVSNALFGS